MQKIDIPKQTKNYVVYGLYCPYTDVIKYVGCTTDIISRYSQHVSNNSTTDSIAKQRWINHLKSNDVLPVIKIIDEFHFDIDAWQCENDNIIKHKKTVLNTRITNNKLIEQGMKVRSGEIEFKIKTNKKPKYKISINEVVCGRKR